MCKVWDGVLRAPMKTELLDPLFDKVHTFKPAASRKESGESYFVAIGYKGEQK